MKHGGGTVRLHVHIHVQYLVAKRKARQEFMLQKKGLRKKRFPMS